MHSTPSDPAMPPYTPPPGPPTQPKKKRRKWPWILGGVFLLLVSIVAVSPKEKRDDAPAAGNAPAPAQQGPASIPPLQPKAPSRGKHIVYEVISDSPSLNSVTWFDAQSAIQQKTDARAPWRLELRNSSTAVIAGVGAQTDGTSVTCRVIVDGKVRDEKTSTGQYAVVNCNG